MVLPVMRSVSRDEASLHPEANVLLVPLSDCDWRRVSHLFESPLARRFCLPFHDSREVLDAILWVLVNKRKWRELPRSYPPWYACFATWLQWRAAGIMSSAFIILDIEHVVAEPAPRRRRGTF